MRFSAIKVFLRIAFDAYFPAARLFIYISMIRPRHAAVASYVKPEITFIVNIKRRFVIARGNSTTS